MSKRNQSEKGISADQAALIHSLLGSCLETSLRQQLLTGEFNASMISKALDFVKHNNITVDEGADSHLKHLKSAFVDSDFSFLADYGGREI